MSNHLFLIGLDLIITVVLVVVAYKVGQWGKQTELEEELGEVQFLLSQVQGENHLLWDMVRAEPTDPIPQGSKTCTQCKVTYKLSNFHTHRNDCKSCRAHQDKERARLGKQKEVTV